MVQVGDIFIGRDLENDRIMTTAEIRDNDIRIKVIDREKIVSDRIVPQRISMTAERFAKIFANGSNFSRVSLVRDNPVAWVVFN